MRFDLPDRRAAPVRRRRRHRPRARQRHRDRRPRRVHRCPAGHAVPFGSRHRDGHRPVSVHRGTMTPRGPAPVLRSDLAARADARRPVVTHRRRARPPDERDETRLRDVDRRRPRPARHDDAAGRSRARSPTRTSRSTDTGRERFFRLLARDFWIDPDAVRDAAERDAARGLAAPTPRGRARRSVTRSPRRRGGCCGCSPGSTAA